MRKLVGSSQPSAVPAVTMSSFQMLLTALLIPSFVGCDGAEDRPQGRTQGLFSLAPETDDEALYLIKLDTVCATFEELRDSDPVAAQYEGCAEKCDEVLDELLSSVVASGAATIDNDDVDYTRAVERVGSRRMWELTVGRYLEADDPVDRVALLSVLARARKLLPRTLPDDAFEQAERGSTMERSLLLDLHRTVPPPPKAVDGIVKTALSLDTPRGLRHLAATALGHPETAMGLMDVAEFYRAQKLVTRSAAMHLGNALGRCGGECLSVVNEYARSSASWERQTAYLAAARDRSDTLKSAVVREVDSAALSDDERLYYERALGR